MCNKIIQIYRMYNENEPISLNFNFEIKSAIRYK